MGLTPYHKRMVVDRYRNDPLYHNFVNALALSMDDLKLTKVDIDGAIELSEEIYREKLRYKHQTIKQA